MQAIFDDYVMNSFGQEAQAESKFRQFEVNYKRFFHTDKAIRVLDIGIGRGEMLTCMKRWGYSHYIGVDISPSTVAFCDGLGLNCRLVGDTIQYLAMEREQFGVITLLDVLEHLKKESIIDFLRAVKSALKPGGILIIQVPNAQAPDGYLHRYSDITHEVGFTEHSLAQVLLTVEFNRFDFMGFEQFVFNTPVELLRRFFRFFHWLIVRFNRGIDGNVNPRILHPVFFAIVER